MSLIAPDQLDDRPRPTIKMSPGQYKLKRAYHIDPLMAAMVEVVQPDGRWGRGYPGRWL